MVAHFVFSAHCVVMSGGITFFAFLLRLARTFVAHSQHDLRNHDSPE